MKLELSEDARLDLAAASALLKVSTREIRADIEANPRLYSGGLLRLGAYLQWRRSQGRPVATPANLES